MKTDKRLKKGLALFTTGKYFECHEVMEDLWRETNDSYKDFYKGIIHAAVSLYLLEQKRLPGAKKRFQSALGYLERYRPKLLGVDVTKLIKDFKNRFTIQHK